MAAGRTGLRTLGALALALTTALPTAATDKPLTIQQKRDAVFERVLNGDPVSQTVQYNQFGSVATRNVREWVRGESRTALEVAEVNSSMREKPYQAMIMTYVDPRTDIEIRDARADGLGPHDYFSIRRTVSGGVEVTLSCMYLPGDDAYAWLTIEKGGRRSGLTLSKNGLNPFLRWRLRKPMNASLTLGTRMYESMLDDLLAGKEPVLPISELNALCSDLEPYLTKRFDDGAAKSLVGLARSYEKTILEKVRD